MNIQKFLTQRFLSMTLQNTIEIVANNPKIVFYLEILLETCNPNKSIYVVSNVD